MELDCLSSVRQLISFLHLIDISPLGLWSIGRETPRVCWISMPIETCVLYKHTLPLQHHCLYTYTRVHTQTCVTQRLFGTRTLLLLHIQYTCTHTCKLTGVVHLSLLYMCNCSLIKCLLPTPVYICVAHTYIVPTYILSNVYSADTCSAA